MPSSPFPPYFPCAYAFQSPHCRCSHHCQTTEREHEDSQSSLSSPSPRDPSYLYTAGDSAHGGIVSTPQTTDHYQHHHRRLPNRNKRHQNHVPLILLQIQTGHQHQHLHHLNPTPSPHQQSAQLQCSDTQSECGIDMLSCLQFPAVADCRVIVIEGTISLNDMGQHIVYLLDTTTQTDASDIRNIHNRTRFGLMIFVMLMLHRRWKTHCGSRMGINCIKLLFI